jgi:hypothetical protein
VHLYPYVPAAVGMVNDFLVPASTVPEAETAPPSKVTLWAAPSVLVQVTVAPEGTLMISGKKSRLCMLTAVVGTATQVAPLHPPLPPVPGPVVSEPLPPQARRAARGRIMRRERIRRYSRLKVGAVCIPNERRRGSGGERVTTRERESASPRRLRSLLNS